MEDKLLKVSAIKHGTVIDHIPAGKSVGVLSLLNLPGNDLIMKGINFPSKKMGKKDILKIENKILNKEEVEKLAMLCPMATINTIKNGKVVRKHKIKLPKIINKVIKCSNPKCICYLEPHTLETKFYLISEKPLVLKCHYCERKMEEREIELY